ncbi:hypothetical protein [Aequorivita echinoideorum]|uniref:CHRD domain-containing protein n=1 Tax=Aequorivita echinoideorum TaxID=1549647 RepID=A0ABS5S0G2_9FLAO|nr:hypothetical protein [Aequorivita echinoideorum]MBT0606703.1 hypothetical protein [Aequorivita echinoideorum]
MKNLFKLKKWMVALTALLILGSCNNDDNNDSEPQNDMGEVNFTLSGDITGNKTGFANFIEMEQQTTTPQIINMFDNDGGVQTFSLTFYRSSINGPLDRPTPGNYPIGNAAEFLDGSGFSVIYTNTTNDNEYGLEASGSLTISEINDTEVIGTFSFSAEHVIDPDRPGIQVSNGSFRAKIRQQ